MKKILYLILFISVYGSVSAQNSCSNPDTIVTGSYYTFTLPTNMGAAPVGPDYNCLGTTDNPLWFFSSVCSNGILSFTISSSNSSSDVDFICWGPITGVTNLSDLCTQVSTGTIPAVDCSFSTTSSEVMDIPNAQVGEYYLFMITNYSNQPGSVNLYQSAGNAVTCDSTGPAYQTCQEIPLPVCEITMNDSATHCKVLWEKNIAVAVDKYFIHRLNAQSQYVIIDSIPDSDSSFYVDYSSIPASQPYRYLLSYRDTCGNYSNYYYGGNQTPIHQSIHLLASPGFNTVNLNWDEYLGINFPTYYILRGTDPFNMNIIDSISSVYTSYTDLSPNASEPCYQVGFTNPNPCAITRSFEMPVVSNVFNTQPNSIDELMSNVNPKIYPNPARDYITFELNESYLNQPSYSISDVTGREIMTQNILSSKTNIDLSNYFSGIYFLTIKDGGRLLKTVKLIKD